MPELLTAKGIVALVRLQNAGTARQTTADHYRSRLDKTRLLNQNLEIWKNRWHGLTSVGRSNRWLADPRRLLMVKIDPPL